jgi:ABC-2 type transport system ATP-binding protein
MSNNVRVTNLSYAFGPRLVLDNVSFKVASGKVTLLLGPNGAGKTTLFSLVAGLLAPHQGFITLPNNGRAGLAIVFQQPTLDIDLTVQQNLTYHAGLHGLSRNEAQSRLEPLLLKLDLENSLNDKVRTLNGGHRRRVEIIRALMTNPAFLLLDEPTSGLDAPTRQFLVDFLHTIAREKSISVLWATHLTDEADPADDVLILHKGKLIADGNLKDIIKQTTTNTLSEAFSVLTGASKL